MLKRPKKPVSFVEIVIDAGVGLLVPGLDLGNIIEVLNGAFTSRFGIELQIVQRDRADPGGGNLVPRKDGADGLAGARWIRRCRQNIRKQERRGREIAAADLRRWNHDRIESRVAGLGPFKAHEKEGPVLSGVDSRDEDRGAESEAELIGAERRTEIIGVRGSAAWPERFDN